MIRKLVHFVKRWSKELSVAAVLAIVAAVGFEAWKEWVERRVLERNRAAVAEVFAYKGNKLLGQGSGVFISETGLLITNYHVIEGAHRFLAKLPTGAYYQTGQLKGADRRADIAVLQFDATETPCVSGLGDSDRVETGQKVLAIGAPLGLESSVSEGIISNPKRPVQGINLIQFTAPISPGSSGGGLFERKGPLLGLTSGSLRAEPGLESEAVAQNLNFAVPINLVKDSLAGRDQTLTEGSPDYYYSLGTIAETKHDWDKAISAYTRAIELDDKYVDAYMGLAGVYYEKGQYDQEVANYEKAAKLAPGDYSAQYWLGTAYEDQGRYDEAVERYRAAIAIKPDKTALHDLIIIDLVNGDRREASELIPKLKQLDAGLGRKLELLLTRSR